MEEQPNCLPRMNSNPSPFNPHPQKNVLTLLQTDSRTRDPTLFPCLPVSRTKSRRRVRWARTKWYNTFHHVVRITISMHSGSWSPSSATAAPPFPFIVHQRVLPPPHPLPPLRHMKGHAGNRSRKEWLIRWSRCLSRNEFVDPLPPKCESSSTSPSPGHVVRVI